MIGKIYKFNHSRYTIYCKILYNNGISTIGVILKSDCPYLPVGSNTSVYLDSSLTEISEQEFNKIMVFE